MPIDSNSNATLFESPAEQVEALGFPDDLRKQAKAVYDQTFPEGQDGGMKVTDLRLTSHAPYNLKTEGEWEKEEGWVMLKCCITHACFAVPKEEPVPTLTTEYRFTDGKESVFCRPVHPQLAADRSKVALYLVAKLGRNIRDRLMDLIGGAAKLEALSKMRALPKTAEDDTDGEGRGSCEYESVDPLP